MDCDNRISHRALWDSVSVTDPAFTKPFKGNGYSGTAIAPTYQAKRATEVFGPMGVGWGVDIIDTQIVTGTPLKNAPEHNTVIVIVQAQLWYEFGGKKGHVNHFGSAELVSNRSYGAFTDSEAHKKALTSATSKCLSMLGFSSDIFLGYYDHEDYREFAGNQVALENAENQQDEKDRQRLEYAEWKAEHLRLISTAVSPGELRSLYTIAFRKMERVRDERGIEVLKSTFSQREAEIKSKP